VNRSKITTGSVGLEGYEGWFPLSDASFSFSFGTAPKKKADYKKILAIDSESDLKKELSSLTDDSATDGENSVSCSKSVDSATASLMYLSVKDKLQESGKRDGRRQDLAADIHFVEVALKYAQPTKGAVSGSPNVSAVKPYLKIALEQVEIESWSLSGSGDDRPTESFNLKFDSFAIQYSEQLEGNNFRSSYSKGFSQTDRCEWLPKHWNK
jgi:hypothetical protein